MGRFADSLARIEKVDNHALSMPDKVELRRKVLAEVQAPVFDGFAGSGEMFRRVWTEAPGYVGCDLRWFPQDPRPAFVADNRRVLRCFDLQAFGIFDLDAYGSPWEQAAIIAARRKVRPRERIGLCLTDGSNLKLKMGDAPKAMAWLAGLMPRAVGLAQSHDELVERAVSGLCRRMTSRPVHLWRARGKSAARVLYLGLVIEGLTEASHQ
jgi:hypothetical protein